MNRRPGVPGSGRFPGSVAAGALLAAFAFGWAQGLPAGIAGTVALGLTARAWGRADDASAAFRSTWWVMGTAHVAGFHWVVRHPEPGPAVAGALAIVLIPLLVSAAWSLAFQWTRKATTAVRAAGLAGVNALSEWVLLEGPLPLPWGLPTHLTASLTPLDGLASLAGWWTPAAVVVAVSMTVSSSSLRVRVAGVLLAATALAVPLPRAAKPERTVRVGLVQPGLSIARWERDGERLSSLVSLTDSLLESATGRPDWVVWPETALRTDADRRVADSLARGLGLRLVSGSLETDPDGRRRNAVRLFGPVGTQAISKRRLVPWVEWIPLEETVRTLAGDGALVSSYRPGSGDPLLQAGPTPLGVVVCFESLFPDEGRIAARAGARVLVAVTNDSWWSVAAPARAHLAFSRRRAVETGLPIVQASVGGFTGTVDPDGRVRSAAAWRERRASIVTVTVPEHGRNGGVPVLPGALLLVALSLLSRLRNSGTGSRVDATP